MRLDTLRIAQYRAYWIHNQRSIGEPNLEYMVSAIERDLLRTRGEYDGIAGLIVSVPGSVSVDYSFAKGIATYRHTRKNIHVKLYFDDGRFEIISREFDRSQLKMYLVNHASLGAFECLENAVRGA